DSPRWLIRTEAGWKEMGAPRRNQNLDRRARLFQRNAICGGNRATTGTPRNRTRQGNRLTLAQARALDKQASPTTSLSRFGTGAGRAGCRTDGRLVRNYPANGQLNNASTVRGPRVIVRYLDDRGPIVIQPLQQVHDHFSLARM